MDEKWIGIAYIDVDSDSYVGIASGTPLNARELNGFYGECVGGWLMIACRMKA